MSDALAVLRRVRAGASVPRPQPGEVCELCNEPIAETHGHVVDREQRSLMCACRGCYLLFTAEGAGGSRFRAVPTTYRSLPDVRLSAARWDAMQVPVGVAFFFLNSAVGDVAAFYPSPAGATESLLPLDAWGDLVADHPELADMVPDVEALLVRVDERAGEAECFVVPIDACYELVGQLRRLWRGFDGGAEARTALDEFFTNVRERSQ